MIHVKGSQLIFNKHFLQPAFGCKLKMECYGTHMGAGDYYFFTDLCCSRIAQNTHFAAQHRREARKGYFVYPKDTEPFISYFHFRVKRLFLKLWPLLYKRAELDLRSTKMFLLNFAPIFLLILPFLRFLEQKNERAVFN